MEGRLFETKDRLENEDERQDIVVGWKPGCLRAPLVDVRLMFSTLRFISDKTNPAVSNGGGVTLSPNASRSCIVQTVSYERF